VGHPFGGTVFGVAGIGNKPVLDEAECVAHAVDASRPEPGRTIQR
jgi:hypothetical protein